MLNDSNKRSSFLWSLLGSDLLRYLSGLALVVFLPAVIFWNLSFKDWVSDPSKLYSLIVIIFTYTCSFISVRQFITYLGGLSFRMVIPVCFFWLAFSLSILFVFRFSYSVYFIGVASVLLFAFFILSRYLLSRIYKRTVSYIPLGRIYDLPNVDGITWVPLADGAKPDSREISMVMADLRADLSDDWEHFLAECALNHIPVYHSSRLIEMATGRVKIDHMYENNLGSLLPSKTYQASKYYLDLFLIVISLPLVVPLMIITALLIKIESPGRVFFLQKRIGQGGKPFTVYKFRSMCQDSEKNGAQFAKSGDMRVTRVGHFIRKVRIDELPQFFNVIKGEMSLIGPRPEQIKFVEEFNKAIPFYDYRHIVKPGLSGWAQVTHGYAADENDTRIKLEYDFFYIKNFSFSMDLLIFFKTIQTVLTGFGAR